LIKIRAHNGAYWRIDEGREGWGIARAMRLPHFAVLIVSVARLLPAKAPAQGETTSAIVGQLRNITNAVPGAS
jgi:hypothetical protein